MTNNDEEEEYSSYTDFYYKELFPSAILYGMSSQEFWEGEPQLYWAYRFSFEKKIELESKEKEIMLKTSAWLNGKCNEIALEVALNNAFSKSKKTFPTYKEMFEEKKELNEAQKIIAEKSKGIVDKNVIGQIEFDYWARN